MERYIFLMAHRRDLDIFGFGIALQMKRQEALELALVHVAGQARRRCQLQPKDLVIDTDLPTKMLASWGTS